MLKREGQNLFFTCIIARLPRAVRRCHVPGMSMPFMAASFPPWATMRPVDRAKRSLFFFGHCFGFDEIAGF
jgi:hypothetical protein